MISFNPDAAPLLEVDTETIHFDDRMDKLPSEVVYDTLDELMIETGLGVEALNEHRITQSME